MDYKKINSEKVKEDLSPFLESNKFSEIKEENGNIFVVRPWNDESLRFDLSINTKELIDSLNNIILFPTFTGLYHKTSRKMEFIFTPYNEELKDNREFKFRFEDNEYSCKYSEPSDSIYKLAEASEPCGFHFEAGYRNLREFKRYIRNKNSEDYNRISHRYDPVSFWILDVSDDEEFILRLARHINFYMYYFDRETPRIVINQESLSNTKYKTERYLFDTFPEEINSSNLDQFLLGLWESAFNATDIFSRYLYFYQMIEYVSFYFVKDNILKKVSRILCSPETPINPSESSRKIIDLLVEDRMQEEHKLSKVIEESVDPETIWKEIEPNKEFFSQDIHFDGGFISKAIINENASKEDFCTTWTQIIPNTFRNIRNALVHSRETRMSDVISPTKKNDGFLKPFIPLLRTVAMQTTLHLR